MTLVDTRVRYQARRLQPWFSRVRLSQRRVCVAPQHSIGGGISCYRCGKHSQSAVDKIFAGIDWAVMSYP